MNNRLRNIVRLGIGIAVCLPVFAGTATPAVAPEPATIALISTGIAAVAGIRYYRSRKR